MALKDSLTRFARALTKRYPSPFSRLEAWGRGLTPSDRLVVGVLGFLMFFAAGSMIAMTSLSLSIEVPARGGTYIEGVVGSPRFVNPLLAISETDRDLTTLVYSGLMRTNPDGTLSPDLASSYTISDDKLTYTFVIRPEAVFQNNTPVTAEDVAFTVHKAQDPEVKSPMRANWEGVAVAVVDLRTVSFTLKAPYAPFIENATMGILPQSLWESVSAEEFPFSTLNTNPVGSGPYRVESVKENASGIPTEYHLRAFTKGVRVPYIDRFTLRFYQNTEGLVAALDAGEIQSANSIAPDETNAPTTVKEAVFGRVFGVFFNQNQNKIFTHAEVRAALDASIDKNKIIDTVLNGYGSVIDGPLPPQSPTETEKDARPEEERIAEARAILEKAGWVLEEDGVYVKKNKSKKTTERLSFSLSTGNDPQLKRSAESVAEAWRGLGADVELKFFEENDLTTSVIRPRKYDALLFGLVVGDDVDLFAFWHSSQRNDPGLNIGLYASIDVDKKLETARAESDIVKRRSIAEEAAAKIRGEHAATFLYAPHFVYLVPKAVGGVELGLVTAPSDRFANVDQWYLAKERIWPIFMKEKRI